MENSKSNFVRMLDEIWKEEEITSRSFSYDWAFRLEKNGKSGYILGYQFGLNSAVTQAICSDKSVASEIMKEHGISNVPHHCIMSPPMSQFIGGDGSWQEMLSLLEQYKVIVCKDNEGTGGKLVFRVANRRQLEQAAYDIFANSDYMAISPFQDIKEEYRVIVLDGKVKLIFSKVRSFLTGDGSSTILKLYGNYLATAEKPMQCVIAEKDANSVLKEGEIFHLNWKHNLGQGAGANLLSSGFKYEELSQLACEAAKLLKVRFGSIDIIDTEQGMQVLEVNTGVMMEHFAGLNKYNYELAKHIYKEAILKMLSE